jgi:hypothetical protein
VAPMWRAAVKLGRCKRDWEIVDVNMGIFFDGG